MALTTCNLQMSQMYQRTASHMTPQWRALGRAVVVVLPPCGQITSFLCTAVYTLKTENLDTLTSKVLSILKSSMSDHYLEGCFCFFVARSLGKDPCPELPALM